jgi:predicted enzyme related to lactoylglutathione lyase
MGVRTSYSAGTFSWSELATSDAAAAKAFYTALFAWEYDDMPVGDGQVYSMAKRDGGVVRMPQGTIAVIADPQGAVFAVWSG